MQDEYFFQCPHCWQQISFILDLSVRRQKYIEDCEVCCNPIEVTVSVRSGIVTEFEAQGVQ